MTMPQFSLGELNYPLLGLAVKDIVQRVMRFVRSDRHRFTVEVKGTKHDGGLDMVSTSDLRAQEIFVKLLRECFPSFGIIGEELGLR
ncbi:MAG: hypothetical protein NUW00_03430, partial [Candidatus Kaiserbacteria bacterium]|nr:hypothetical protein [Candidatus Kaiserbacteria bacterium]